MAHPATITSSSWTLPALRPRALTVQFGLLLCAAWLLPAAIHLAGLPVRQLLPMHWPVIVAGLCYGWRSGAVIGVLAPFTSYVISGMPRPAVLPAMALELAAYGLVAGFVVQVLQRGRLQSTLATVVAGRLVFLAVMVFTGAITTPLPTYLENAMLPGALAAVLQVATLPLLAQWWVRRESRSTDTRD